MTAVMGPGSLRADRYQADGILRHDAHVVVTAQAATRVFGGGKGSASNVRWTVEDGAFLELINEPVVPFANADCALHTTIEIAPTGRVAFLDLVSLRTDTPCLLRSCTQLLVSGRLAVHDQFELRREAEDPALTVGVFAFCDPAESTSHASLVAAVDHVELTGVRIGIGRPRCGGLFVRVTAARPWAARDTLHRIRDAALVAAGLPAGRPRGSF